MKFWLEKSLEQLSDEEWEKLCDGCGRCCVLKYEDEDSGEVIETNAACKLLDCNSCQCSNYAKRFNYVPECTRITVELLNDENQRKHLPYSCAYRQLAESRPLEPWHPLISGTADSVIQAGISLAGQLIPEDEFDDSFINDEH